MNMKITKMFLSSKVAIIRRSALLCLLASSCVCTNSFAGEAQKWAEVPEAVRATILVHGGKPGAVDKESHKVNGKVVYEAVGKDKSGNEVDLVIAEDGQLIMTKDDDAAERAT